MQCIWTLFLLQLVALWANAAVITENGLPILWDQAPSQLSELPQVDNVVTINPWNYLQRMSLYRTLVGSTDKYMASMGTNETDSLFWGLPLQMGWKLRSGRLVDPTGATTCGKEGDPMCISANSWWACVNYYLSVIPFLAAVQKDVIGDGLIQVQVQAPAEAAEDYCTSYTDCSTKYPDLMAKWEEFFQTLKDVSASEISDFEKRDQILGVYWAGQQLSLNTASTSCKAKMSYYSSPEVSFAQNWMNSADYVAATYFQSNLNNSVLFMSPLPSRVLQEGDSAPNIADLSKEENHTLYIFGWMTRMNRILMGSLVRMWRSAMCSDKAREKGRELLQDLVHDPKFAASTFVSILKEMTRSC
ncbi:protein LEG1 homolog isoform 2-T2 [Salvelinus alpinus]|uniref:protein LEG1 homolog isoform X2 n=1 Tax=Salvelinus sp. IW2-2015 TaxID=2691554 RepID=UPI000CDF7594|nr:protein LEG1 homolog [Salvelinus alpinus]